MKVSDGSVKPYKPKSKKRYGVGESKNLTGRRIIELSAGDKPNPYLTEKSLNQSLISNRNLEFAAKILDISLGQIGVEANPALAEKILDLSRGQIGVEANPD